jgi:putative SOS response-associated peptidase YedK
MCGRMTQQTDPAEVARIFDAELRDPQAQYDHGAHYNVAPTQAVRVVVQRDEGRFVELQRWGLVPAWSAAPGSGSLLINARAEGIDRSPAFRSSFARRRCIVPADGFYEWRRLGSQRQPFLLRSPVTSPLALAGLWAPWRDPRTGDWLLSCAVVTTAANRTVAQLHDRMPVILSREQWSAWLDPDVTDAGLLRTMLRPAADGTLETVAVSSRVNNVNNEGPDLVQPVLADDPPTLFPAV